MDFSQLYKAFEKHSDSDVAQWMHRYMRGLFDFYGIKQPLRHKIQKNYWQTYGYPSINGLDIALDLLWSHPKREAQYTAMDLIGIFIDRVDIKFINTLQKLITTKSWWDTVDILAAKYVYMFFERFPEVEDKFFSIWLAANDIWLNRTAIIYQLRRKIKTDTDKLAQAILQHKDNPEFFIQKAIGWALREYSKTDKDFVIQFVEKYDLSQLSRREALRYLNRKK